MLPVQLPGQILLLVRAGLAAVITGAIVSRHGLAVTWLSGSWAVAWGDVLGWERVPAAVCTHAYKGRG